MDRRTLRLVAMTMLVPLAACQAEDEAAEKTVLQLMVTEVQPTAEIYWDSVQFVSDETGDHDIFPKTDAEWQRTRDAATKLAQIGELLKTPDHAEGRGQNWIELANGLVEVSKLAAQAAEQRSTDKVLEVGGTLYNVCTACHQAYPAVTQGEADKATPR
jgi:hypothetical protein